MVIAIKIKEHTALSTKIVDGKYFLKGHLNCVSPLLCQSTPPLIESSFAEDDKVTVRESVASPRRAFPNSSTLAVIACLLAMT